MHHTRTHIVCDGRHVDALYIVDVSTATAKKGSLVNALSQYIEFRVDELDFISFDKQTDLSLNHQLYGRSAVIVDNALLFNLDSFPIFDALQENLKGSDTLQISYAAICTHTALIHNYTHTHRITTGIGKGQSVSFCR